MRKHHGTRRTATTLALVLLLVGGLAAAPVAAGKFSTLPHAHEVPRLAELLRVQADTEADVVTGPLLSRFERTPPRWVTEGAFF